MTKKEKLILERAFNDKRGLFSPADFINGFAEQDRQAVERLVAEGFVAEVQQSVPDGPRMGQTKMINFYRLSQKGLSHFYPWYKKVWSFVKGDVRTVTVAIITTIITVLIGRFLESHYTKNIYSFILQIVK